ncbi:histidine phosphatase family protein, partial [Vibrio alginolyticus]
EVNSGRLQGLLQSEIEAHFPDYVRAVRADPWNTPRPQGESMAEVSRRVEAFLRELPSGRFLIVTHGGVIRAALKLALNLDG